MLVRHQCRIATAIVLLAISGCGSHESKAVPIEHERSSEYLPPVGDQALIDHNRKEAQRQQKKRSIGARPAALISALEREDGGAFQFDPATNWGAGGQTYTGRSSKGSGLVIIDEDDGRIVRITFVIAAGSDTTPQRVLVALDALRVVFDEAFSSSEGPYSTLLQLMREQGVRAREHFVRDGVKVSFSRDEHGMNWIYLDAAE